jgi:precorrin-6Y C5,15-methyltransferase (decarboxylating)
MWFGVGATLLPGFAADEVTVLPHPGAFSLAAARMGWPLAETACLTVHGRPLEAVALHLYPGARLLVLSEDGTTPARLAGLLAAQGFAASRITVLEHLGGPAEQCFLWREGRCADLNTLAVEVIGPPGLSRLPGLPDEAFLHDGQLTKREVRAVTLSALAPWPGALLWDVGAGCGSVAIEWARAGGRAIAIEPDTDRRARIAHNAARLGVPGLTVVAGSAPEVLAGLEPPDAVFIGGGTSRPGVIEAGWAALKPTGRLVANGVTAEAEAALFAWQASHGGELSRIAISRLAPTGRFHTWHPLMPVTQYLGIKP